MSRLMADLRAELLAISDDFGAATDELAERADRLDEPKEQVVA